MVKSSCYLLFIIIISFFNSFIDDNLAIFPLTLLLLGFGILLLLILDLYRVEHTIHLYLLFFFIYLFHTSLVHYGLLEIYNVSTVKPDEPHMYAYSNAVATLFREGYDLSYLMQTTKYRDIAGAVYMQGHLALLADSIDRNSILLQKILPVFAGAVIPVMVYKISRYYFSIYHSKNIAIVYGFFSFSLYLTTVLLRDIYIGAIFVITFYFLFQKLSIKNLFILILLSFFSYLLRPQTGMFMVLFTSIYLFVLVNKINNKNLKRFIYIFMVFVGVLVILNTSSVDNFDQILNSSLGRQDSSSSASSIGAKLRKLPLPLEVVTLFGYGQMQPFPLKWIFTGRNKGILQLSYLISGIAWFLGWGFLLYGIFVKKILTKIDFKLKFIFIFSILYLLLVSYIEFTMRRQMPVYPILYLVMVFSYMEMSVSERTKIWMGMGLFYASLTLLINYVKI